MWYKCYIITSDKTSNKNYSKLIIHALRLKNWKKISESKEQIKTTNNWVALHIIHTYIYTCWKNNIDIDIKPQQNRKWNHPYSVTLNLCTIWTIKLRHVMWHVTWLMQHAYSLSRLLGGSSDSSCKKITGFSQIIETY